MLGVAPLVDVIIGITGDDGTVRRLLVIKISLE